MLADYLEAGPEEAMMDFEATQGVHARFLYLKKLYTQTTVYII